MALQSDESTATGNLYEPSRGQVGRRSAYGEDSPEALRRRADVLLDEMMLGSVDMGAGDGSTTGSESDVPGAGSAAYPAHGSFWHTNEAPSATPEANGHGADGTPINGNGGKAANGYAAHATEPFDARGARPDPESPLISAEDRYKQLATPPAPNGGATPNAAVRRQSPTMASTMTVGVRASTRSNLLPRSTDVDTTAVQQEINNLLTAVSTSLPPGHEAIERSRHLLNKAQNLLQSDPTRSAEVDYYLQQVRRIVERTRQTQAFSDIYRKRLLTYLLSWIFLSIVVGTALAVFQPEVQQIVAAFAAIPASSPIVRQGPLVVASAFAGALGAAIAMLFTMRRQSRREFGYFDRKYGLRGLLLPLLGLFFGLLLSLVCAVIYTLADIDPAQFWWALAVPMLLAFVAGFGQDRLYGAR
jgi:hypothetical protein